MISDQKILQGLQKKGLDISDEIFRKKDLSLKEKKILNVINSIKNSVLSGREYEEILERVPIRNGNLEYLDFFRKL